MATARTQTLSSGMSAPGEGGLANARNIHNTDLEQSDLKLDVSFSVTQLSKHNNSKKGYWVAIDGLVYDVTKSIDAFPELIPYAGTDIRNKFPELKDKLSKHFIGRLLNPKDQIKAKMKDILYKITSVANELENIVSNKKEQEYKALYIRSKKVIEAIFEDLSSLLTHEELIYLRKSISHFTLLNEVFRTTQKSNADYSEILFKFKGIANLLKFMFEEYISHKLNHSVFVDDLRLLACTEKNDAYRLLTGHFTQLKEHKLTIVGGSITGLALAMQLKKLGFDVAVYDKYDDPRIKYADHASASFSIFITERGLRALDSLGLREKLLAISQPVTGRHFHQSVDDVREDLNGPGDEKLILVRRDGILNLLVTEAEKMGIPLNFDVECKSVNIGESYTTVDAAHVHSKRPIKIKTGVVFGADGSNSTLRRVIDSELPSEEKSTTEQHKQVYCEFLLPADEKGDARFDQTKLHVWPRDGFAFVAFPNEDKSFSLSLFIDKSKPEVPKLQEDPEYLAAFIKQHVPELYPFVHKIVLNEPPKRWGVLTKVDAKKWYHGCHLSLIGDAAHGCYPFNGQAGNCDLEDTLCMYELIAQQLQTKRITPDDPSFNWREIFCEFSKRKTDTDTMANFAKVPPGPMTSDQFKLRKQVEFELIKQGVPSFFYLMSFTSLPYSTIKTVTVDHDPLLNEIVDLLHKKEGALSAEVIRAETAMAIAKKQPRRVFTVDPDMSSPARSRDCFFRSEAPPPRSENGLAIASDYKSAAHSNGCFSSTSRPIARKLPIRVFNTAPNGGSEGHFSGSLLDTSLENSIGLARLQTQGLRSKL